MRAYNVFISSNQKEFKEERFALKELINSNSAGNFNVFLFEDLPAKGKSPSKTYLKSVENSDIYIGIIGNEYGFKGKDGLSATEREFKHFIKKKPDGEVLIFIKGRDDTQRDKDVKKFLKYIKENLIYKRFNGTENLKVQVLSSLVAFLADKGKFSNLEFDERVCFDAEYKDINEQEVKEYLKYRAVKLKVNVPKISVKNFLLKTIKVLKEVDGKLRPTNTGLLFFGKNPSDFITQHEIRIARFKGCDRISFIDSQEIKGPIYKMLADVEKFFVRNTRLANKIVEFKRVDIPEYPYEAIHEGVINAIAHRNLAQRGAPIIISIFDDRVEISSPGGLLPGLNIKNLEGHHKTRNEKICSIFHETKDMERYGTGIKKMKRLMKEHGLSEPKFKEEGDFFVARFYGPGEKILDLVPSIPKHRVTDLKELGLNERQIEALRLMLNEGKKLSNKKYRERFKVSNQTFVRDMKLLQKHKLAYADGDGRSLVFRAK